MTPAQKRLKELRERASAASGKKWPNWPRSKPCPMNSATEFDEIEKSTPDLERRLRASQTAVEQEEAEQKTEQRAAAPDPEMRERIELRSRRPALRNFWSPGCRGAWSPVPRRNCVAAAEVARRGNPAGTLGFPGRARTRPNSAPRPGKAHRYADDLAVDDGHKSRPDQAGMCFRQFDCAEARASRNAEGDVAARTLQRDYKSRR